MTLYRTIPRDPAHVINTSWVSKYRDGTGVPQDDVEAVKWYRKAAEQGNAGPDQPRLMYADGKGVPKDDAEAVKWYRKAAEQGDASAQSNLGGCTLKARACRRTTSRR